MKPARKQKAKPANWTPGGWPDEKYRLPPAEVLEALSRVDDDQDAEPVPEPTDAQLERLEADQAEQQQFDLGASGAQANENSDAGQVGRDIGPFIPHSCALDPRPSID